MKDIPLFDTETGVSSLVLKEIPYKQVAYVTVRDVQPGGLEEHLNECAAFCRMCGAERVYAAGHPELDRWPLHCAVLELSLVLTDRESPACLFPVTEDTAAQWRRICNEKMGPVDNAATMEARDEKRIAASGGAYFVHDAGKLLGIGWIEGSQVLCVASVVPGAGETVLRTLLSAASEERVTLEVASTNTRAIRLYERMGFVTVGERSRWYRIK